MVLKWSIVVNEANFTITKKFPLDWSYQSKNKKYVAFKNKTLNPLYRQWKEAIALAFQQEASSHTITKTKSLISIFVVKKSERGDVTNLIDGICDGIKLFTEKVGLDDNRFVVACEYSVEPESEESITIGFTQ